MKPYIVTVLGKKWNGDMARVLFYAFSVSGEDAIAQVKEQFDFAQLRDIGYIAEETSRGGVGPWQIPVPGDLIAVHKE